MLLNKRLAGFTRLERLESLSGFFSSRFNVQSSMFNVQGSRLKAESKKAIGDRSWVMGYGG
jgi:hypothetical protein